MYAKPVIVLYRLFVMWGKLVRLAILMVGIPLALYFFIDPVDVREIPFSNLTLKLIGENVFFVCGVGLSLKAFFDFHAHSENYEDESEELIWIKNSPYIFWGQCPIWAAIVLAVVMIYF